MTIEDYKMELEKLSSLHADKAIQNFNQFKEKSDAQLKVVIELAIARFVSDYRALNNKPIESN